jgi:uncharacterized protein
MTASTRPHDPLRLDVERLAAEAAEIDGAWPLASLARLCADHPADAPPVDAVVEWHARGERRRAADGEVVVRLRLTAAAAVERTCQRCLRPVALPLHVDRWLRFVADESTAERLDAECDDDVLVLEPELDLRTLVEDELLLALPMVPRHDACEPPGPSPASGAGDAEGAREHPFAALAGWRRRPGS